MREDHGLDQADVFRDRRRHEHGDGGKDICDKEQRAKLSLGKGELAREEVGYPRLRG